MPIREKGYRRREPRGPLRRFRALPIAQEVFRQILARLTPLVALGALAVGAVALIPLIGGVLVLYGRSRFPELRSLLPPLPDLLALYLGCQSVFAVVLTVWAGAGLIADDLRGGVLLMYLSRPLTRGDYILGKGGALVTLNLAVIAIPSLLLWALAVALEPAGVPGPSLAFLPVAIVLQSALVALVLSSLTLLASALARSAALAGVTLVTMLVLFDAMLVLLDFSRFGAPALGRALLRLLSVRGDLAAVRGVLFGVAPDLLGVHPGAALLTLVLMTAAAGALVWRRVRAVEIVR